jgi:hypothetical protein
MEETWSANNSPKLSDAILAIYKSLPRLEKSLSEIGVLKELIGDLRERLVKKEEEVRGAMAEQATVMEKVLKGSQEDLTALLNHNQSESEAEGIENLSDDDASSDASESQLPGEETVEGQAETERKKEEDEEGAKVYFEENTSSAIALLLRDPLRLAEMEEKLVAEQTVKSLRDALSKRQQSIEKALSKTRGDQDRVCREVEEGEKTLEELGLLIEERRQRLIDCESKKDILIERARALESELSEIGERFSAMNEEINGVSCEESNRLLCSARNAIVSSSPSPSSDSASRSPLLQRYVEGATEARQITAEMAGLDFEMSGLGVEAQCREVDEVRQKLRCAREETVPMLVQETEKMMAETEACEAEARVLDGRVEDLLAAMRWGQSETGGLYRPSVCTAPVMLLLFQQHCRQQVPFKRLKKGEMSECVTAAWLRRCGCIGGGLKEAGYKAVEAREGGYSASELKAGWYSASDLKVAGYSVSELKAGGYRAYELKAAGYSASDLNAAGYSAYQLYAGGYDASELKAVGYSFSELKAAGYSFSELVQSELKVVFLDQR